MNMSRAVVGGPRRLGEGDAVMILRGDQMAATVAHWYDEPMGWN